MKILGALCGSAFFLLSLTAGAQSFTSYLRASAVGKGTIVLIEDNETDRIVNNERSTATVADTAKKPGAAAPKKTDPASRPDSRREAGESHTEKTAHGAHVSRQRYKAQGYRIQIFTGGNSAKDRQNAEAMVRKAKQCFPELGAYKNFHSPHWVVRIGDFPTREDANRYAALVRKQNLSYEAHVVSSTVWLAK